MVRTALKKKFFRSIKQYGIQLISISIMLTLGVAVYLGLNTTWRSLDDYIEKRGETYNVADLVMIYEPTNNQITEKLQSIKNIKNSEDYLTLRGEVKDNSSELELNFISENNQMNQFQITSGKKDLTENHCILDSAYATENHLSVGDSLTISYKNQDKIFYITGLANSPAYVYAVADLTDVIPNHQKFGFMYTNLQNSRVYTGGLELKNKTSIQVKNLADVDEIKSQLEDLKNVDILGVVKNTETLNYLATNQKIQQYKSIGNLFPIVFFAVVILMTFTTMYRIINKERGTIGILKALGYGDLKLIIHYLSYGFWVSILGVVIGTLIGWKVVPVYIWNFFEELFILPEAKIKMDITKVVFIAVISILSTAVATILVYLKINREVPASLLRTQTSTEGKHILLERFKPFWKKLSAAKQLTLRQMFRNKVRMFMTIIGVAGCVALLISALGIRDTVDNVVKTVYNQTYLYDEKIILNENVTEDRIRDYLKEDSTAEKLEELSLPMESDSKKKISSLHIIKDQSKLMKFYKNKKELPLNSESVLVTEKMAENFGLNVGDTIHIQLNSKNQIMMKITDIAKLNIGQGIYITSSYWEKQGQKLQPTSIIKKSSAIPFPKNDTKKIVKTEEQEKDFVTSMKSTVSMSMMLIMAAAILAIVVLYNLGYLNFAERNRDLATLSVLGFLEKELKRLLSMENILLSIVGIVLGIPVGTAMHQKIFQNAGMGDELDFTPTIYLTSLIFAVVFTFILVLFINYFLNRKITKIEMTEALKSVE